MTNGVDNEKRSVSQIEVLTGLEPIRRRPGVYFSGGVPTLSEILFPLVQRLGVQRNGKVQIIRLDAFSMVTAEFDWMNSGGTMVRPVSSWFEDAMHPEALIAYASDGFLTVGELGNHAVNLTLENLPDGWREMALSSKRALAWKFIGPPDPHTIRWERSPAYHAAKEVQDRG